MDVSKLKGGSIGLSYPMLAKGNYTAWSMKMRVYMKAHGVWDAVEPSDPKVAVESKTDKVALTMIYQGIPEDVPLSLAEKKTAKEGMLYPNFWMILTRKKVSQTCGTWKMVQAII